jgi:DNA-binding transcriptional MerR regulator
MPVQISQEEIKSLQRQGFSDAEISEAINSLEQEDSVGSDIPEGRMPRQASAFSSRPMDDIARYQLELNDLLEQTEHILKGDIVIFQNGKKDWHPNPSPKSNVLNEEGIRKIMLELQNYINRHIILGDYNEDDINTIMKQYGKKLSNLIFMKYEEMGMDTEEKRQEYASIVMNIVNLVYASYSRAKNGAERRSLREMINIQGSYQSQQGFGNYGESGMNSVGERKRSLLNPMRYIQGKYV